MSNVTDLTLFGDAITSTATGIKLDGANALALSAYNKTIGVVAVDAFIYDTSKDSDGGAWRKRTQHTSWYNETLNTATRGSRREFPAVAVIVAEADTITIYDGDDPDMPMWMVFDGGAIGDIIYGLFDGATSVVMQNAQLVVSTYNFGSGGVNIVDFIKETGSYINESTAGPYKYIGNIKQRNDGLSVVVDQSFYGSIVDRLVNDVAMTVLPSAPIDSATGLPVPTIAVATDGGVSVIKDDGSVVDITISGNVAYNIMHNVKFSGNDVIFSNANIAQNYPYVRVVPIPSADIDYDYTGSGVTEPLYYIGTETGWVDSLTLVGVDSISTIKGIEADGDFRAIGATGGLNLIRENRTTPTNGVISYVTSDYNTGWMPGDIKLATLSDTDATNVTGTELVTNGTFDTDVTGWTTAGGSSVSHQSGQAKVTASSTDIILTQQLSGLVVGKKYVLSATITPFIGESGNYFGAYLSSGLTDNFGEFNVTDQVATEINGTFTATATNNFISIGGSSGAISSGEYLLVDNVSVRLAEPDRSVNNNGLQVFGTVTKTAVATGADLVAYSGFSSSNYLQQPYNSDLDFGTGDFSINLWVKGGSTGTVVFDRLGADQQGLQGSSTDLTKRLYIYTNANIWEFIAGQTGIIGAESLIDISSQWKLLTCIRKNGVMSMYENGVHKHSKANTDSVGDTDHITRIGTGIVWEVSSHSGSVALIRVSATAPTAEQIAKMYNDEKFLFQDNAQSTLYGTSDAVTALAYDEKTELLHAGTSQGRSVFQGLRRVDNTTDAVATTISARNQMIAEQ